MRVRAWYNRAYTRAAARQQHANVFLTVHTPGMTVFGGDPLEPPEKLRYYQANYDEKASDRREKPEAKDPETPLDRRDRLKSLVTAEEWYLCGRQVEESRVPHARVPVAIAAVYREVEVLGYIEYDIPDVVPWRDQKNR